MRDEDSLPISTPTTIYSSSALISNKKETLDYSIFRRGRYKFWALAAIILLAFWSMFTGTVTLRLSVGNLNRLSDDIANGPPIYDDFDVLEMEEREKVVKHMWDVYTNSRRIRLPRFWQEAFVAAYEDLTSDTPEVREAAISEIARMSLHSIHLDPPPLQSTHLLVLLPSKKKKMKASFRGSYDANNSDGTGSIVVNAGGVNLQASVTGGTFFNGPLLNDLTLSVESPGSFVVDYIVPKKDVRFQFMNTFKINEKPLNLTYTHSVVENQTSLDGKLALNSNHKVSANYGFKSGSCKVKYNYVHGGVTTIEPCYDFAENSWDLAVSRRVDDDSVVRASYQSSTRVLGLDLRRNSSNNRSIKVSASVNLADKEKKPTIKAESIWDIEM